MNMLKIVAVPMHKEGRKFVAIFAAITVALSFLWEPLFWLGCGETVWCCYFFRDLVRMIPQNDPLVLSPADGVVALIEEVVPPAELGLGQETATWASVFMNVFNCHVNRVPLTDTAIALLGEAGAPDALVFDSEAMRGTPISDMSMTAVLRRMARADITVHGLRSTFRDWAGETTGSPREVIEAALAHGIKDKAEAAYARSDLFDKRRKLMEAWEAKAIESGHGGNVIAF